jgi:UDP-N-acetyl-D-mannosaminuronic acid transferase (WecB/TagA/CpsF family)
MSSHADNQSDSRTILGIRFFQGTAAEAVRRSRAGGLVIVPAAPALKDLATDPMYRESLLNADLVLADSAFMVLIWNMLQRDRITRLSGLEYLRELIQTPEVRETGETLWVMPSKRAMERAVDWLAGQGIDVPESHIYLAPIYTVSEAGVEDPTLTALIERIKPKHVMLTVGGGTQEPLGYSLRRTLSYVPAIHCVGAGIAFLSGDQIHIPVWADYFYLGWLFRTISDPRRFGRRYWDARKLFAMLYKDRERLPELRLPDKP